MTTCERAVLVEASFDGRLGRAEEASLARHRRSCRACADLFDDLERMRGALRAPREAIAPLVHQRARLALLKKAASPAPRRRPALMLLAAALVLVPVAAFAGAAFAPRTPATSSPLATATARASELRRSTHPAHPAAAPVGPSAEAPKAPPAPEPVAPGTSTHVVPTRGAVTTPAPSGVSTASSASREFADAVDAIGRGDFGAGATMLDRFAATHPSDPRAEEAIYLRAIAFERAGRVAEARAAAQRYLARYPNGAHLAHAKRLAGD